MASFFEKARERAQAAAAQFNASSHNNDGSQPSGGGGGGGGGGQFTYTGGLPHMFRQGVASVDPRYEYNRSFHRLSGAIKSARIDHEALARETKAMGTATYRWGQDQLGEQREDSVRDEAIADVSDRLAYMLSLSGDLHAEHAKRVEASRTDLKRMQKLEADLAPRRQARVKIHRELKALVPERAKVQSEKIDTLESQLKQLETEDKEKEEEVAKLKREALRSSYDSHFDSMIELGEKMAIIARHGKLLLTQLPVYSPPFPAPRHHNRTADEPTWDGETQVAAIRAAVEPALESHKPDYSTPSLPSASGASSLSRADTVRYAESHKDDIENADEDENVFPSAQYREEVEAFKKDPHQRRSSGSGGSGTRPTALSPPALPPRSPHATSMRDDPFSSPAPAGDGGLDVPGNDEAAEDNAPTLAETGSPIASGGDPGPKSGTLAARAKSPTEKMPMPRLPSGVAAAPPASVPGLSSPIPTTSLPAAVAAVPSTLDKTDEARAERETNERREVAAASAAARVRPDGSTVQPGDPDYTAGTAREDLPPYKE